MDELLLLLDEEPPAPPDPTNPFGLGRFFEAPPWRLIVTALDGRIITWLDKLAHDRAVTFTRGEPTIITCGVPADNPEVNIVDADTDPFVHEGTRLLYAFRREGGTPPWRVRAAGAILQVSDAGTSDEAQTMLAAFDSRQILHRRPVLLASGELPSDSLGLPYEPTPGNAIIVEQLDRMLANADGPLPHAGLDWGQTAFYDGTIETTEDVEITFSRGSSIGEVFAALEQAGHLDIVIRAIWDPVNRPGYFGELSIYERAGSFRPAAIFGWDVFPKSLIGIDRIRDGKERVNTVQFYAGQGGPPVTPYSDAAAITTYGDYFAQQFFPGQVSQPAVEAMARRVLALARAGVITYRISPAAERAPIPLSEYHVFDRVPVYASRNLREPISASGVDGEGALRVESLPIVIGDDQLERVLQVVVAVDEPLETGT